MWRILINFYSEFQIAFLIVEREQRLPIPSGCPKVLANLMQLCWQTEPKARPTFKSILYTLDQIDLDGKFHFLIFIFIQKCLKIIYF